MQQEESSEQTQQTRDAGCQQAKGEASHVTDDDPVDGDPEESENEDLVVDWESESD
jgi:hypothetical protein